MGHTPPKRSGAEALGFQLGHGLARRFQFLPGGSEGLFVGHAVLLQVGRECPDVGYADVLAQLGGLELRQFHVSGGERRVRQNAPRFKEAFLGVKVQDTDLPVEPRVVVHEFGEGLGDRLLGAFGGGLAHRLQF